MIMDQAAALAAFAALSQATRLDMVRVLVRAGPEGLAAGVVADAVGVSSSAASFHLAHLERAGLVQSQRAARSIIYSARYPDLSALIDFLLQDCCQGHPEICGQRSAGDGAESCCAPEGEGVDVG